MSDVSYFLWLSAQIASGLLAFWYVSVVALALVLTSVWSFSHNRPVRTAVIVAVACGLLAPVLVAVVGATFRAAPGAFPAPQTGGRVIDIVSLSSIVCQLACVALSRTQRLAVASFSVGTWWPLVMAGFVAGMSTSGDWL